MACPITEPPQLQRLPRHIPLDRLPTPATNFPHQTENDPVRAKALSLRNRCHGCGCLLGDTVWRPWLPTSWPEVYCFAGGGTFVAIGKGPSHLSCALYSITRGCPFLKNPRSRGRLSGRTRGELQLRRFATRGLVLTGPNPHLLGHLYEGLLEIVNVDNGHDLLPAYQQALAEEVIDLDSGLWWTDSDADRERLALAAREDETTLAALWERADPFMDDLRAIRFPL